jgi:hypothetical protein
MSEYGDGPFVYLPHSAAVAREAYLLRLGWCLGPESNRHDSYLSRDFKSLASTNFATEAVEGRSSLNARTARRRSGEQGATSAGKRRYSTPKPLGLQAGELGMVFKKPLRRLAT